MLKPKQNGLGELTWHIIFAILTVLHATSLLNHVLTSPNSHHKISKRVLLLGHTEALWGQKDHQLLHPVGTSTKQKLPDYFSWSQRSRSTGEHQSILFQCRGGVSGKEDIVVYESHHNGENAVGNQHKTVSLLQWSSDSETKYWVIQAAFPLPTTCKCFSVAFRWFAAVKGFIFFAYEL